MADTMIKVEGLTKRYPGTEALRGVTFEIPAGEIFGFVGPNGAGKTTTLRILATLLPPSGGRAYVGGIDVMADPYSVRDVIGYMPDFFGVYDQLTTNEYLAFYASCYQVPRRRRAAIVCDLLELIGMTEKARAEVNSQARGLIQRRLRAR